MGIGDAIIGSGIARGAAARGKRIAFGDGRRISWDANCPLIYRNNPNIAPPGSERTAAPNTLEWIDYRKGNRHYNWHEPANRRWRWNMDFRAIPGEFYLDDSEREEARRHRNGFVVIESDVPAKAHAVNKQWGDKKYEAVARDLLECGHDVIRFVYPRQVAHRIKYARLVATPTFRHAVAMLERAALYIGPEGGLHHAAAAVNLQAVVLFGGFIPPQVTGYSTHTNLTGGAEACGSLFPCDHCRKAMDAISVDEVVTAAHRILRA